MTSPIDPYLPKLADLCRQYHVRRLELFGSAANGKFDPATSDFDFLVEFDRSEAIHPFDQFFGLLESLEALVGRRVDLVDDAAISNPYFRRGVDRARKVLYAA